MTRCLWCNRSGGDLRTVTLREGKERRDVAVHPAHEESLVAWHARAARDTQRFVTIVAFTPLVLLAAVGLAALVSRPSTFVVLGLALIALACVMWTHPYATPQIVRLLGVRRSITVVRAATVLVALAGAVALAAGLAGAPGGPVGALRSSAVLAAWPGLGESEGAEYRRALVPVSSQGAADARTLLTVANLQEGVP